MVYPQADKMIPTASTPDQPGLKKKQTQAGMNFDETQNRYHFFHCPRCGSRVLVG